MGNGVKHKHRSRKIAREADAPQQSSSLGLVLGALIAVQGSALALKAFDETRTADQVTLNHLQGETLAIAERLSGTTRQATTVLSITSVPTHAQAALPGTPIIVSPGEASAAAQGGRLKAAAEVAAELRTRQNALGLSARGDLVVLIDDADKGSHLVITPADAWLPTPVPDQAIRLIDADGRHTVTIAENDLAARLPTRMGEITQTFGFLGSARFAQACIGVSRSPLTLCTVRVTPSFNLTDGLRLLAYSLLFAAPVLALIGLYASFRRERNAAHTAEAQAAKTQHIFDIAMEGAEAGFWHWDRVNKKGHCSAQMRDLFAFPRDADLDINDYYARILADDRESVQAAIRRGVNSGAVDFTHRLNTPPPHLWVEIKGRCLSPDETGAFTAFSGIAIDITERKQAEGRVVTAERHLRSAVESFSGPFAVWDQNRRLRYWNTAYAETFELKRALRKGMSHETATIAAAAAIRQERPSERDSKTTLINLHSGKWISMVERRTSDGGTISVGVDVTETVQSHEQLSKQKQKLKRLIQELERSEARAAELTKKYAEEKAKAEHAANTKSAFLANMSHELRTPLNAINGFSEILTSELFGPIGHDKYKEYANDILASGQHLLDLINDILDMAKIEAGKMSISLEPIDPIDPVDAAIRMIRRKAEEKGVALILDTDENLPLIDADHRAVKQMALNLLSNAIKFTEEGGRIAVTIRLREDMLRIAITDTGVGIPKANLSRLAQPFEQVNESRDRNFGGTGLGLALTKSFAEMHGGKLTIASQEGRGTTVAILLPAPKKTAVSDVA